MKLELITRNEQALQTLAEVKLRSAQAAWDMAEALEEVQKSLKRYHDKRNDLIKKFGTPKTDDPGQFQIDDLKGFNKSIQELLDVEVGITFPHILITELNGSAVSPADMIGWKNLGIIKSKEDDSTKEKDGDKGKA